MNKRTSFSIFFVLGLLIVCAVCTNRYVAEKITEKMYYFKDYRTNLCFVRASGYENFFYVPCTPEVEKLIVNIYQLER